MKSLLFGFLALAVSQSAFSAMYQVPNAPLLASCKMIVPEGTSDQGGQVKVYYVSETQRVVEIYESGIAGLLKTASVTTPAPQVSKESAIAGPLASYSDAEGKDQTLSLILALDAKGKAKGWGQLMATIGEGKRQLGANLDCSKKK